MSASFGLVQEITGGRLPTFTTAHINQTQASLAKLHVDSPCPVSSWLGLLPIPYNINAIEQDHKLWMYTSLQPYTKNGYNNLRLDNTLLQSRLLPWDAWLTNVTGYLYWGVNQWNLGSGAKNASITAPPINASALDSLRLPFEEWNVATCGNPTVSSWCSSLSWLQGDGRLLYAGADGPISSIRLAALRDGLEDAQYLAMAEGRVGRAAVQTMIAEIASSLTKHTDSASKMLRVRRELAMMLSGAPGTSAADAQ